MAAQRFVFALVVPLLMMGMACGHAGEAPQPQEKLKAIQEHEESSRAGFLGVSTRDLNPSLAKEMKIDAKSGALVTEVVEDSPAEKAGIAEDDVIIEFNGKAIEDASDLVKAVRKTDPGSKVSVVVVRGTQKKTLQATVGKRSAREFAWQHAFTVPEMPRIPAVPHMPRFHVSVFKGGGAQGLNLMGLNSQLREYFGAPEGKGVLVEKVDKRSAARDAGFKAGDVILRMGKEEVENVDDVWEILEDVKGGDSSAVEVLRKGSRLTLQLKVDEEEESDMYHFRSRSGVEDEHELQLLKENSEKLKQNKFKLQQDMKKLQEELRSMGKEIRSRMDMLRKTLNRELRQVIG